MIRLNDYPIITIDCNYQRLEHAAAYLIIEDKCAALIDNNTVHAIPCIMRETERHGLRPEDIRFIIPTHLHLDHAGATSELVRICPNATVISHPRGVRHYADPARLIAGVKAVYGNEEFNRWFGEIKPIPIERIRSVDDGERIAFGARFLTFLHTRGHANHSITIHDSRSNGVFTGDTFGVEYRKSRMSKKPFLFCSTAPTDFDPAETRKSVRRILALNPECLYLAHFGGIEDVAAAAEVFLHFVARMEAVIAKAAASHLREDALMALCEDEMRQAIMDQFEYCGVKIDDADLRARDTHLNVNAKGVALVAEKLRSQPQ